MQFWWTLALFCWFTDYVSASQVEVLLTPESPTQTACPRNVSWVTIQKHESDDDVDEPFETNSTCCSFSIQGDNYGWVASPHRLQGYEPGIRCEWIVKWPHQHPIELRVKVMRLMQLDIVHIYEGVPESGSLLTTFDGAGNGEWQLQTKAGAVRIHLVSNTHLSAAAAHLEEEDFYGFNMSYQLKGICIPGVQRACVANTSHCYDVEREACNGVWDCIEDGSDEWDCSANCSGPRVYFCPPATSEEMLQSLRLMSWDTGLCYLQNQRCDGVPTCVGLQDELRCSASECGVHNGTWLCPTSGECIYAMYRCDGVQGHCLDNSDEIGCDSDSPSGDPFYAWRHAPSLWTVVQAAVLDLLTGVLLLLTAKFIVHAFIRRLVAKHQCEWTQPEERLASELHQRPAPPTYEESSGQATTPVPSMTERVPNSISVFPEVPGRENVPPTSRQYSAFTCLDVRLVPGVGVQCD